MPPRRTVSPDAEVVVVFVGTAADAVEQEAAARVAVAVLVGAEQRSTADEDRAGEAA